MVSLGVILCKEKKGKFTPNPKAHYFTGFLSIFMKLLELFLVFVFVFQKFQNSIQFGKDRTDSYKGKLADFSFAFVLLFLIRFNYFLSVGFIPKQSNYL